MSKSEHTRPISYMKTHSADLVDEVRENPVIITQNGEARAVLQSIEDFRRQKDALLMLRLIALGEKDIKAGEVSEQSEMLADMDKLYK